MPISLRAVWEFVSSPFRIAANALKALAHTVSKAWTGATTKMGSNFPSLWKVVNFVVAVGLAIVLTSLWPLLCVGLVVAGATRHVKSDYMKVILVFVIGALAYGLLFSGIFFVGDILFALTTMAVIDMLALWGKRIREVAEAEELAHNL